MGRLRLSRRFLALALLVLLAAQGAQPQPGIHMREASINYAIYPGCDWAFQYYTEEQLLNDLEITTSEYDKMKLSFKIAHETTEGPTKQGVLQFTFAGGATGGWPLLGLGWDLFRMSVRLLCGGNVKELAPFTPGVGLIMDIRDFARSIKNIEKVNKLLSRAPVPAPVKFAARKINDFLKIPDKSASEMAEDVAEKCKKAGTLQAGDAYIRFNQVCKYYNWARYLVMIADQIIFPEINRKGCHDANDLIAAAERNHPAIVDKRSATIVNPGPKLRRHLLSTETPLEATKVPLFNTSTAEEDFEGQLRRVLAAMDHIVTLLDDSRPQNGSHGSPHMRHLLQTAPYSPQAAFDRTKQIDAAIKTLVEAYKTFNAFADQFKKVLDIIPIEDVADVVKEVESVFKTAKKVFKPLFDIGGVFSGIADIFSFIRCPSWLFICNLDDLIEEAVNSVLEAFHLPDIEQMVKDLLDKIGIPELSVPLGPLDSLQEFADTAEAKLQTIFGQLDAFMAKFQRFFVDEGLWNPLDAYIGSGRPVSAGVTLQYVSTTGGKPASFNCDIDNRDAYPVVVHAARTQYACIQDISAFVRLPCSGKVAKCDVDFKNRYPSSCTGSPDTGMMTDETLQGILETLQLPSNTQFFWQDAFTAVYYCVDSNVDFKVLPELITVEGRRKSIDNGTYWTAAGQRRRVGTYSAVATGPGNSSTELPNIDCSGGSRLIYLESLTPPVNPISPDNQSWDMCATNWTQQGPYAKHKADLCWWSYGFASLYAKNMTQVPGRTKNNTNFDGSTGGDEWGWFTNFEDWRCLGDASTYFAHAYRVSPFFPNIKYDDVPEGMRYWSSLVACQHDLLPGCVLCKCELVASRNNPAPSTEWCDSNFTSEASLAQINPDIIEGRRSAYAIRNAVYFEYTGSLLGTGGAKNQCKNALEACHGKAVCEFNGCYPGTLTFACVEAAFFSPLSPTNRVILVYAFGDSAKRVQKATCPADSVAKLGTVDFGGALDFTDVAIYFTGACSDNTCSLHLDTLQNTAGKSLRAEVLCTCGAGKSPKVLDNNTCADCQPGSYRDATMPDCVKCPPGTYQNGTGQTKCLDCPKGFYTSQVGTASCTPCRKGTASTVTKSISEDDCLSCPKNQFAPDEGSTSCQDVGDGKYTNDEGASAALNCPAGQYRAGSMNDCESCPPGKYSIPGAAGCEDCPAGQFSAIAGQPSCSPCEAGTYSSIPGSKVCTRCPNNGTTPGRGTASASDCLAQPDIPDAAGLAKLGFDAPKDDAKCTELLALFGAKFSDIGNRFCNPGIYNTRVCGYDGGDCCAKTCQIRVFDDGSGSANDTSNDTAPLVAQYSCSPWTLVCLDPDAQGGKGGDCSLASTAQTPEPANSTGCDPSTKGNGLCDPNNNFASCEYDGGDCCQGSCKFNEKLASQGSCTEKSFNCRDPNGDKDVIPPILQGVPPDVTVHNTLDTAVAAVTAVDNSPCFNGIVNFTETRQNHPCGDPSATWVYKLKRTWSATDEAGNTATAMQTVTVLDIEPPKILNPPNDTVATCNDVPLAPVLQATDDDPCFSDVPKLTQSRVDGTCKFNYTLQRVWNVSDAAGLSSSAAQLVQVYDTSAPVYPAGEGVKGCLWPPNNKYYQVQDLSTHTAFSFSNIKDNCSGYNVKGELVRCTSDTLVPGTKGVDAGCKYDPVTKNLKLLAARRGPKNTYSIVWRATDECGNAKDFVTQVVVGTVPGVVCWVANLSA